MQRDFIRTHEAMADLLRYSATGARVELRRVRRGSEAARAYSITIDRHGRDPINVADSYVLPCDAESIRQRVRQLLDSATR